MSQLDGNSVGLALIALVIVLLWRGAEGVAKLDMVLWGVMMLGVLLLIIASYTHFHSSWAFGCPAGAFDLTTGRFWARFGADLAVGLYDYLGHNTAACIGAELKDPGRTLPRATLLAINAPGRHPVEWSLAWVVLGLLAFAPWARVEKTWPFGPKEIHEQYLRPDLVDEHR